MASGISISPHHLKRFGEHAQRLQRRLESVSKKTEHAFERGVDAILTVGSASLLGLVHGRRGPIEVAKVPVELAVGALGLGASIMGVGGKWAHQVGAVADGLLAGYGYNLAKGIGMNMKATAEQKPEKTPTGAAVTGELPRDRLTKGQVNMMQEPVTAQRSA